MALYPESDSVNGYSIIITGDLTITPGVQGNFNEKLIVCQNAVNTTITLGMDIRNNFKTMIRASATGTVTVVPATGVMINGASTPFVMAAGLGNLLEIVYGVRNSLTVTQIGGGGAASVLTASDVAYLQGLVPPKPVITTSPTIVGSPTSFTSDTVTPTQQWTLDGADASGGAGTTYTQSLSDSAKVLRVRQTKASGTSGTSPGTLPGMRNWKRSNTGNLRAMLAGGVRGRIIGFGDSYIAGHGANGVANDGNRAKAWVTRLAAGLTAAGKPASASFGFGASSSASAATMAAYDPRYSFSSSGSGLLGGIFTLAGAALAVTAAGGSITFTPGGSFDTVDILYLRNTSGQGSFNVSVDGGTTTIQTVVNNGAVDMAYISIAVPAGSTAVTLLRNVGSSYFTMIGTRTSSAPGIEVYTAGQNGIRLQQLAIAPSATGSQLWNARACMAKLCDANARNTVLINGWYNDTDPANGNMTIAQTGDSLRTLLAEIKTYAEPIYCAYAALGGQTGIFRAAQDEMMRIAIEEFDLPVFDMSRVITSQSANASLYYDSLHLGLTGHPYPAASAVSQFQLATTLTA